ncbi:hypothetical protein C8R43DRAFT_1237719 [Mycena crocata]|nr:hypothetical protein C8R43DRAFT_1237719 [Mycena crocata]
MTDYLQTPVVRRRVPRLASNPYMQFQTDFRPAETTIAKETQDAVDVYAHYPSFRRAISIEVVPDAPEYLSFPDQYPSCVDSSPPVAPRRTHSLPPITSQPLECVEESDVGETGTTPMWMRSPTSSTTHASLLSPSTEPRWTTNFRMVRMESIEENELEDDDTDDRPPITSSPGRSSDPFFPPNEFSSSPQTDSPIHDSPVGSENPTTTEDDFSSKLYERLVIASQQRESDMGVDNDLAATLQDRSISITPDYPVSSTPPHNRPQAGFGPRAAARSYSWSSSSSCSYPIQSCHCSGCQSRVATRSDSLISGYAADLDTSSPIAAEFRSSHSATPTERSVSAAKRSYSSLYEDTVNRSNSYKKIKPDSRPSSFSSRSKNLLPPSDQSSLSRVPASLRKSLSLRSDASLSNASRSASSEDNVPTVPNTPRPTKTSGRVIAVAGAALPIPFSVPIIAPPSDHVGRLPLTREAAAKIRIGHLLAREERFRAADKLDVPIVDLAEVNVEAERLKWERILGVGPELRRQVVDWILEVLPKKSMYRSISSATYCNSTSSPSASASASVSSSFSSAGGYDDERPDLLDQLLSSPETRFHAAYMFARYFYLLMTDQEEREKIELMQQAAAAAEYGTTWDVSIPPDGWMLVAWDCCLACLAISVKLHRDVLEPLAPVLSWEFEALAPHKLLYEDLEIAQRDVLSVFSYSLGGTPQAILDELWLALPSLQQLLQFGGGWNCAQKEAWAQLFDAVSAPDVLKFPISLLTVAALSEALVPTLVSRYEYDAALSSQAIRGRRGKQQPEFKKQQQKLVVRAEKEIEGVVQDMQAVMQISDASLRACQSWLRAASKD